MRIAFTDGEMTNLSADFGQLLCAGIAEYNPVTAREIAKGARPWKNVRVLELPDYANRRWVDGPLAIAWRDALEEYDIIVTWNGVRFDLPFLNTRLVRYGAKEYVPRRHKDLMYTARFRLKMTNAQQDTISKFYRVPERYGVQKTPMYPEQWCKAMGGHRPSYQYIITHCANDIKVLAALWQEMKDIAGEIK